MISSDFEALLTGTYGCYITKPSAINWAQDSDFQSETDMITILTKDRNGISNCVRKKSEGIGTTSFYFESTAGNHYFKVVEQNNIQTGAGGFLMEFPKLPEWAVNVFMHAASGFFLGFSATFVANPAGSADLSNALYGACVIGMYGAIKEVVAYIETIVPQPVVTNAEEAKAVAPVVKPTMAKRML